LVVRVAAIIIALSSGLGIVLYAAAWLLLPRGSAAPALVRVFPPVARVRSRTWTVLVCAAALVVLVLVGFAFSASLLPTMVVLGILYAAQLRPGGKPGVTATPMGPPPSSGTTADPDAWPLLSSPPGELVVTTPAGPWRPTNRWGQPLAAQECAAFYAVPDPVGLYGKQAPARHVRRSRLVAMVSGLAIAAVCAMLSLLGAFVFIPPVTYLAVGLVGVGTALIVGAFVGRPTGFIAVAVALVLLAAAVSSPMTSAGSERSQGFATAAEMPSRLSVDGTYALDLSRTQVDQSRIVEVTVDGGNARLSLPQDGNVVVVWRDAYGNVSLPDGQHGRNGQYEHIVDPARPTLTLSVTVTLGNLDVTL
ncbi:MAG TPA: PspC domain-containing protein, partial [Propionibacteriaceae bacterium]|nr:PspC domain-containing protein [Propionibacteriaceae bacterium]